MVSNPDDYHNFGPGGCERNPFKKYEDDDGEYPPGGPAYPGEPVVVVDPDTGGRKQQKLAQYSQIPADVLHELAEHYGRGNQKYPDVECECAEIAELMLGTTPEDFAKIATCGGGGQDIRTILADESRGSRQKNTKQSFRTLADSVGLRTSQGTSITTTHVARLQELVSNASVDPFAIRATSALGFLRELVPNGKTRHLPGCNGGSPNWQRGYNWRLSVDALGRHLNAWLQGEDFDPETGTSHLVCAIWHLFSLRWFQINGKGTDFR